MNRFANALVGLVVVCAQFSIADTSATSEEGIRAAAQSYTEAFNRHDADSLAKLWSEDAVYIDRITGERTSGRAAIQEDLAIRVSGYRDGAVPPPLLGDPAGTNAQRFPRGRARQWAGGSTANNHLPEESRQPAASILSEAQRRRRCLTSGRAVLDDMVPVEPPIR